MKPQNLSDVHSKSRDSTRTIYAVAAIQKVITFTFNNLIVRQTNPQIFGVAAVQLELLLSTMLFLSREGEGTMCHVSYAAHYAPCAVYCIPFSSRMNESLTTSFHPQEYAWLS